MRLIENMQDILANINTLDRYLEDPDMSEYVKGLIKRGICFLAVKQDGYYRFYPSRFIGYKNNSQVAHDSNNNKDGRVTNPAISAIIGYPPTVSEDLEREYQKYCERLGFNANKRGTFGVHRKFWEV